MEVFMKGLATGALYIAGIALGAYIVIVGLAIMAAKILIPIVEQGAVLWRKKREWIN